MEKQTYGHGEKGGEGEMYGKSNMATYITICKRDRQREFAVWLRKLKQGLWINLEGLDGQGNRRELQKGEDLAPRSEDTWGRVWLGTPDISCSRMPWTR